MNNILSTGVTKLGANIASLNMPKGISCRYDAPCMTDGCYCNKGRMNLAKTKDGHMARYEMYKADPVKFFNMVSHELDFRCFKYFRYHAAGDIVDAQYLDLMCKLARKHKETHFLCFTKKYELVNGYLDTHRKPSNLVICLSNWGEWKVENPHNLPESYVDFGKGNEGIPEFAYECSGHCDTCPGTHCWHMKKGDSVMFHKH